MQTKLSSLIESCVNTFIGFLISLLVTVLIFPVFGIHVPFNTQVGLTAVYTGVSILRSYAVRRFFNLTNFHVLGVGRCPSCNKFKGGIARRRIPTNYFDDESNHTVECPQCYIETNAFWQEAWEEYRQSQGV